MAACRQLGFDVTENRAIRSADPDNSTLEPNMNYIGLPVAEIRVYVGAYGAPIFGEGKVLRGQQWHHSRERWWFPIGSPL